MKAAAIFSRWIIVLLLALGVGGAVAPAPAQAGLFSISVQKEKEIGADAARSIEAQAPLVSGPVADWVESLGSRLTRVSNPEFTYSFRVIQSDEINAFALPGGYIYVNTGLRKVVTNDDELAAVLAHEITHAEEHHFARQYKKAQKRGLGLTILSVAVGLPGIAQQALSILDFAMTQKYSRAHEFESDLRGMARMQRAGFDPQGMPSLLSRLSREHGRLNTLDKWFGSHPDGAKRVAAAEAELKKLQPSR